MAYSDGDTAITATQRSSVLARLPACLLMLVVVAYAISQCCNRFDPADSSVLLILLLPVLWWLAMPQACIRDGLVARLLLVAVALEAWMAIVQGLRADALPAGWWRFSERSAALACFLVVVVHSGPPREMVRHFGASAACALIVCVVLNGYFHLLAPLSTGSFGFAHVNILVNCAGPALIAWLVLVVAELRGRQRRPSWVACVLLPGGAAALAVIAVTTQRRGVLLGMCMAGAWLLARWSWARYPRRTLLIAGLIAVAAVLLVVRLLGDPMPTLRNERVRLYRAGLEGIAAGWPMGFGHYGALHLQSVQGEMSRHMTADGGWGEHIHDEFLDICLDGGPLALILSLCLVAGVIYRLRHIRDGALQPAFQAMAAAIAAHLITDNVYATRVGQAWLGIAAGMVCAAGSTGTPMRSVTWLPGARVLAMFFAFGAGWGALRDCGLLGPDLPTWSTITWCPALLPADAPAAAQFRCAGIALDPQELSLHEEAARTAKDPLNYQQRVWLMANGVRDMGWTQHSASLQLLDALGRHAHPSEIISDSLSVLRFSPFVKECYEIIAQQVDHDRVCAQLVPRDILGRIRYLRADPHLPPPDLSRSPGTIDAAADAYAHIIWAIASDRPWSEISVALEALCRGYGDIPEVAQLVVQAVIAAPAGTFPWITSVVPILAYGLRSPAVALPVLSLARNPAQARALWPLVSSLYPGILAECRAGRCGQRREEGIGLALRYAIVRIWSEMERQHPLLAPRP